MPNNERLLTEEERFKALIGKVRPYKEGDPLPRVISRNVEDAFLEAQDTKTASLVRKEVLEEIEEFRVYDDDVVNSDYSVVIEITRGQLQALKAKLEVKND